MTLHAMDRAIVRATQAGLPLCREPYRAIAEQLGLTPEEVLARLEHKNRIPTLIAQRDGNTYRFDIRLQGDRETIFFDI